MEVEKVMKIAVEQIIFTQGQIKRYGLAGFNSQNQPITLTAKV